MGSGKIAFFASDEIALPALGQVAAAGASVAAVVTQPDRPRGRGQTAAPNAIAAWAHSNGVPVLQPDAPDAPAAERLRALGCELALVMAYGHILRTDFMACAPLGFFNLHASLLPKLRGATPIEGAIVSGLAASGVSLQRVAARLDAGDVIDAERIPLNAGETRGSLREKCAAAAALLVRRALPRLLAGDAAGVPQNEAEATFTRKITRADAAVDFRAGAAEIAARVRALSPWPGVTFPWNGLELKIGAAEAEPGGAGEAPGRIIEADASGVRIATGDGVLRVTQLQRPTAKMLPAGAFLTGFPLPAGTVIGSRPMAPLVSAQRFRTSVAGGAGGVS